MKLLIFQLIKTKPKIHLFSSSAQNINCQVFRSKIFWNPLFSSPCRNDASEKRKKGKKKKTNSSSNIDPTLFANSCTRFDWVRFATRKKKNRKKKEREGKRNLTGRGGRRDTVYFYRSPSAGIFLFDGKYSWRRTVHARFVTARILPTALKSLDKFYDVSLRAFFSLFSLNQKKDAASIAVSTYLQPRKFLILIRNYHACVCKN